MIKISIEAEIFSHGKAKLFRRGISDALVKESNLKELSHSTYKVTYEKDYQFGIKLKKNKLKYYEIVK